MPDIPMKATGLDCNGLAPALDRSELAHGQCPQRRLSGGLEAGRRVVGENAAPASDHASQGTEIFVTQTTLILTQKQPLFAVAPKALEQIFMESTIGFSTARRK